MFNSVRPKRRNFMARKVDAERLTGKRRDCEQLFGLVEFPRDSPRRVRHFSAMSTTEAARLLEEFRAGKISREKMLRAFQAAPVADLGFAQGPPSVTSFP